MRWNDSLGFIICFPISYIAISTIIGASVIMQSRSFNITETIVWILVTVVYLLIGISWFRMKFDLSEFDFDIETENPHLLYAAYFILFYILAVPTLIHGVFVAARVVDRGLEDFTLLYKAFLGIFCFGLLLMTATIFLFVHWIQGVILLCCFLILIWFVIQAYLYVKNDFFMRPVWQAINFVLAFIAVISASVVSLLSDEMVSYEGVSFSLMTLLLVFWIYSLLMFIVDIVQIESRPVFFSNGLFPIYKYNPVKQDIEDHYTPTIAFGLGIITLMIWSFFTAFSLTPSWFGVVISVGVQELTMISIMYLVSLTRSNILSIINFVTPHLTKKAWILTKQTYYKQKAAVNRLELLTYRKLWVRRFYLNNLVNAMQM